MKTFSKALFILAIVGILLVGYLEHASAHTTDLFDGSGAQQTSVDSATLVTDMNKAIAGDDGISAAATLIDLTTGKEYDAGQTGTIYKAASTAKVLAAVDYLHEVEQGNATLTQTLDGMTAQQAIKQMIEVSDNDAWAAINDDLGDQQQTYAESLSLSSFTGGEYNTMTARDEAKLLAQLAEGKLLNSSDRTLLYTYMSHTDSTNLIQAVLPSGATVYHKYGELWGDLHDAAIVNYQGHSFVLVIFTNNPDGTMDEYDNQVALIHAVTTAAFSDITNSGS